MSVVVLGSIVLDVVTRVAERPKPGETVRASSLALVPGGKGLNQAVAAARAGAEVSIIGAIGDDAFAEPFVPLLDTEGIDHAFLAVLPSGTGLAFPVIDAAGQNTIVVAPRANDGLQASDIEPATSLIAAATVLVAQQEIAPVATLEAFRIAAAYGVPVLFNAAPAGSVPDDLLRLVDVLIVNEFEAATISGLPVTTLQEARAAADALAGRLANLRGPTPVILTLGKDGALLHDGEVRHHPAYLVPVVDTVGAGDAFIGTLAARLAGGESLSCSLPYAMAAGALACTVAGSATSMPSRADVDAFLRSRS